VLRALSRGGRIVEELELSHGNRYQMSGMKRATR
jgi:hypothetical protein